MDPAAAAGDPAPDCNVTPYTVTGSVDYQRLVVQFGTEPITPDLIVRLEKLSKLPLHHWLRRGLFYSHRSLNEICDAVETGKGFYLYTGRGASTGSLHLGHLIPLMFTKWLQDAFDVPLVVQLADDEKFFSKGITLEDARAMARENIKDIISVGFSPRNTFIFCDFDYIGTMYPNVARIQKLLTLNQIRSAFGFVGEDNIGKYAYPAIQAAPSFSTSFPHIFGTHTHLHCLIPCAIDQDPFFRLTRHIAPKLRAPKPAVIHSKFLPGLQSARGKMASSDPNDAIFISDSDRIIAKKIRAAVSGAPKTLDELREKGANLEEDVAFQYLCVFDHDDERLERIRQDYSAGRIGTGDVKNILISILTPIVTGLRERRAGADVDGFSAIRPLEFPGADILLASCRNN